MVCLVLSTLPADPGLHTECNTHLTPKAFVISLVVWDHKGSLLSLHKNPGNPNLGIISLRCPSEACFCPVKNASVLPEKILYHHKKVPKIAYSLWHDCEVNLPVFPRVGYLTWTGFT